MPGRVIRVVEMREFNFNDVAANGTGNITAAQRIDVSWAREVTMAVRWHKGTIGSGASVSVIAFPDGFTTDDPTADFVAPGESFGGSGSVTISSSDSAPLYEVRKLASTSTDLPTGAMLRLWVTGSQPATPGSCDPVLSIDLVLRD